MASKYKERQRALQQDVVRDKSNEFFSGIADKLEGKGRTVLYALGGLLLLLIAVGGFNWWSNRKTNEAQRALGRAMEVGTAQVTATPLATATEISFPTEQARAERAAFEYKMVADKYGNPTRDIALYLEAVNQLKVDRAKGYAALQQLTQSSQGSVATLAKFALAQANQPDAKYDDALKLYNELVVADKPVVSADTARLNIAEIYEKQGKKTEAADILFKMVETARKKRDKDGKPVDLTASAQAASQKLERLDPAKFAALPKEDNAGSANPLG